MGITNETYKVQATYSFFWFDGHSKFAEVFMAGEFLWICEYIFFTAIDIISYIIHYYSGGLGGHGGIFADFSENPKIFENQ